mgnify:CR=1 FL=1
MKNIHSCHFTKEGKEVIIRTANEDDASNLIKLKKSYIRNTSSIPLHEFEYTNTPEQEAAWIKNYTENQNSLLLLAEHDNKLIGNIDLTGNQRKKLYHTGMIGMGIAPDWQNRKIGSLLMEHTIKWAFKSPLSIIWLEVYSTNNGGIKLYEKFGFEACGLIKDFFKENSPADKITMVKYL